MNTEQNELFELSVKAVVILLEDLSVEMQRDVLILSKACLEQKINTKNAKGLVFYEA